MKAVCTDKAVLESSTGGHTFPVLLWGGGSHLQQHLQPEQLVLERAAVLSHVLQCQLIQPRRVALLPAIRGRLWRHRRLKDAGPEMENMAAFNVTDAVAGISLCYINPCNLRSVWR